MGWGPKGEQHLCSLFCPFEGLWSLYFFLSGVSHPAAPGLLSRGMRARLLADPQGLPVWGLHYRALVLRNLSRDWTHPVPQMEPE